MGRSLNDVVSKSSVALDSVDATVDARDSFDPGNSAVSLRSFLKEMKFENYSDSQIWDFARHEYPRWRDERAYVVVARLSESSIDQPSTLNLTLEWVPQKRRGSEIYCSSIWGKFQPLLKAVRLDPQRFIPASFLTLTSDSNRGMQWNLENIENGWNHMLTLIRQRVGRTVQFLKVVELTKKGHAHIHAVLFNVPFISKKWLSTTWNRLHHAYVVDISAVRNIEATILYLIKHQQKVLRQEDTQAYFWFHRKRSWTTSRALFDLVFSIVDLTSYYLIQKDFPVLYGFRLTTVVIGQEKDPPNEIEIPLTREDMIALRAFSSRDVVEVVVLSIVSRHFDIPSDWLGTRASL